MGAKRVQWTGVILLGASVALAGCSDNQAENAAVKDNAGSQATKEGSASSNAKEAKAAEGEETVVTLWGASDFLKGNASPGQQMVKAFNEQNKGHIRVDARYMPWAEYNTAVQAAATSGELPDIFQTPQDTDIRTIVANGWAQPFDGLVSDAWKTQFTAAAFAEGVNVIDGKTYSWPLTGPQLNSILYYNKGVLEAAGLDPEKPPATWDELRAAAKTVTEKGKGDVFGLVFGGGEHGDASGITKFVGSLAGGINSQAAFGFDYKTGRYEYGSDAIVESFDYLTKLKADGSILPSSYTLKNTEASALFGQGKAAFLVDGRARMWIVKRDSPDIKLGLTSIPTKDGSKPTYYYVSADPSGYLISSSSKHAEAAGEFIEKGFASLLFYEKYLHSGVALTPIASINDDASLYPYPEFNTFLELHKSELKLRPDYAIRNPLTAKVIVELGSLAQPKIKPGYGNILQSVLIGAGSGKDIATQLKAYDEKLNKGLDDAIAKVKGEGANVSRDDFTFPDWDGTKDFTLDDYKQ
ncbi:ABC transporter substrate-binding protein [Paenibacillus sacheonensis]|uniref:Extracellular solute-binding protein n=1 Tax=Paenibacillus sacheonensis TaxID=742054 RepID=A0A7X5BZ11_9BACL|nr:extracellular solute-binding protein [Paenibacillus sacheonensis]MBM7563913.1 ABC-type glycerol-3-phosphate transport system substrate-binding protein [Paenibacillus sacheonensis]NBC67740.1 extracellular solute-binding protein [Paenibacillus sacheonensis]